MASKVTKGRLAKYPSTTLSLVFCARGSATTSAAYSAATGTRGDFSVTVTEAITGWFDVIAYEGSSLRGVGTVYYAADEAGTYYVDDPNITASDLADIASNVSTLVDRSGEMVV
jgi:hypothetical protein